MNLNDLNKQPWPKEAVAALDVWQQGDVVSVGPRVMWVGVTGEDALTGTSSDVTSGTMTLASEEGYTSGLAVITTQTCDVIGAPPGTKQPWVQVSPVCAVDPSQLADVQRGWLLNHVLVTADLGLGDPHAVDLRHSFPVSKSVLLQQMRKSAFRDEVDVLNLAERLAVKAGRASHHDLIGGSLAQALKSLIKAEIEKGTWRSPIEQFRIIVAQGTRLQPRRIRLLVLTHVNATSPLTKKVNACVKAWKRSERKALAAAQIDVESVEFRTIDEVRVSDYRNAVYLPIEEVTRTYWF